MTNAFSKIAKATLGLVVAGTMIVSAAPAFALTASDISMLQAAGIISASQAASLMASVSSSPVMTSGNCYQFTTNLAVGTTSGAVEQLQTLLNANSSTALAVAAGSNGSAGHETTYFGPATAAAVVRFQTVHGISPTAPQVGPQTRAALNASCTSTGPITTNPGGGSTTTNGVTAMLSLDNPAAGTVVAGQALADLAHFTFTGNGTVSQVMLQRSGFATNSTLTNVYLYNGVNRITDAASVNSSGMITFNNVNLAVNGSATISVKSDIDGSATNYSGSIGVNLTGFTVNGVTATANLMGNVMSITSGSGILATVQVGASTSPATGTSGGNTAGSATVNAGASQYVFFSTPVQISLHSVALKALRLSYIGSAQNGALGNLNLYIDDGVQVGTSAGVMADNTGSYVMFNATGTSTVCGGITTTGACLVTGTHTLEVRGDILSGSARTVQFSLQNPADIQVMDIQNNVNVGVTTPGSTSFNTNSSGVITINGATGGSVTAQIDPTFQSVNNITGGATNVAIAKYKLTAYGENEKIQTVAITPNVAGGTPSTNELNNVQLYYNGSQVGSSMSFATSTLTFNLGSQLIVTAGTSGTLEVRADLQNAANTNFTAGTITVSGLLSNIQGTSSLYTSANATLPTSNSLSIQTGLLSLSKNSAFVNQTVTPNTSAVKIGSFVLNNTSSTDSVRVTNLNVAVAFSSATGNTSTNLSNLRTSVTSGSGATPINPATAAAGATSTNNFSVNMIVAPGTSQTVDVFAHLGSQASGTVTTTLGVTAISQTANTTLTVAPATGQVVTLGNGTFNAPTLLSSSTTTAQYVAAGSTVGVTNASKASFNFTESNGSATIQELRFSVAFTNASGTTNNPVTSVTVNGQTASVVLDGSGNYIADLNGLSIAVPNGGSGANVDAYVSYAPVGTTGVTSSSTATLTLAAVRYVAGSTTTTTCISGYTTPSANCNNNSLSSISAPTITLVASKPTLTVNSTQQTGLILGAENKIGEVTITADTAGNISVKQLKFNVGSSGFASGTATVASPRLADGTTSITGTSCSMTSAIIATCTFSPEYTISAGTAKTFSLFANVSGGTTSGATVSVSTQVDQAGFLATDVAGNGVSGAITGTLIYNFPTNSYSIRQ